MRNLHFQLQLSVSLIPAASIVFMHCRAMLATIDFSLDCLHNIYIITHVKIYSQDSCHKHYDIYHLTRKKVLNVGYSMVFSLTSCNFLFSWCWFIYSLSVLGAYNRLGLILKDSIDIGRTCIWCIQLLSMGTSIVSSSWSRWFAKAKFMVKYISKSGFSCSLHASIDSNKK